MTQKKEVLALETLSQVRQSDIEAMSFKELDDAGFRLSVLCRKGSVHPKLCNCFLRCLTTNVYI
jgi:hypothetical protein